MDPIILTKNEFKIMCAMWKLTEPASFHKILDVDPEINRNTLLAVLAKLQKYNMVEVAGYGYNNTSLTRLFQTTVSQPEYLSQFMDAGQKEEFAKYLIDKTDSEEMLDALSEAIAKRKEQLASEN